jgi:GxxExxY protein
LLLKDEVYQIVGSAFEVLKEIGHGLHEKPYENALVVEFGIRQIPTRQQASFDVIYKAARSDCSFPTSLPLIRLWSTQK